MSQELIPIGVNLNIKEFSGTSITASAGMMTNAAVIKEFTSKGETIYVTQRPSITVLKDASDSTTDRRGRGIHYWNAASADYFINNDTIYKNSYGTPVGTISPGSRACTILELGTYMVILDAENNEGWTVDENDNLVAISDSNFPSSLAYGGVQLGGYLFVMAVDGIIWQSDLDNPTVWSALDFIDAERENDGGVFLGKMNDHIVAIGSSTIEFFYNAGNTVGSVLNRRQDIHHDVGCVDGETVWSNADFIYFVGADNRGQLNVYHLENFKLITVSNSDLDGFISTNRYQEGIKCIGSGFSAFGSNYYMLSFYYNEDNSKHVDLTLVFENASMLWHVWDSQLKTIRNLKSIPLVAWSTRVGSSSRYGTGILANGDVITFGNFPSAFDRAEGSRYVEDNYVIDNYLSSISAGSDAITLKSKIGEVSFKSNNNKFMRNLELVGPYTKDNQEVIIRWSDTSANGYHSSRRVDMKKRRKLSALGMFNRRSFEIETTPSEPIRLEALEVEIDRGTN